MTAFLAGLLFSLLAIIVQYPVVTTWETELLWQIHQWHIAILHTVPDNSTRVRHGVLNVITSSMPASVMAYKL